MVAGDSKRENKIGVANGFPKTDLVAGEVIVLQDALDVLGLAAGDKINIQYDLFQAAITDLSKLKQILFDFEKFKRNFYRGD